MSPAGLILTVLLGTAAVLVLCIELGHRIGKRSSHEESPGISTVDAAVFALVGFLLSFAFSGAQTRLETRRNALVQEANAIGTAYLRTDLLSDPGAVQPLYREFLEARIAGQQALPDLTAAGKEWERSGLIGRQIWEESVQRTSGKEADRRLVLDSVNQMLDQATVREVAARTHLPTPILGLLGILTAIAAVLAGRAMAQAKNPPTFHRLILAAVFALVLTALVDLEHPRAGFIRLESGDTAIYGLQKLIR